MNNQNESLELIACELVKRFKHHRDVVNSGETLRVKVIVDNAEELYSNLYRLIEDGYSRELGFCMGPYELVRIWLDHAFPNVHLEVINATTVLEDKHNYHFVDDASEWNLIYATREMLSPTEVVKSQPYRHLKHRYDGLVAHCTEQEQKLNKQATQLRRLNYGKYHSLDVWFWMPDEDNYLDSITCPIVIQPEDLKALKDKIAFYEACSEKQRGTVNISADEEVGYSIDIGESSTPLRGPAASGPDFDAYKRFVEETGNAASFEQFKGVLEYHRLMEPDRWTIPAPPKSPVEPPLSRIEPTREPISDPRLKNTSVANRIMKRWKTLIEKQ